MKYLLTPLFALLFGSLVSAQHGLDTLLNKCEVLEIPIDHSNLNAKNKVESVNRANPVISISIDVDYSLYQKLGSNILSVQIFVANLIEDVQKIYALHNIKVRLSSLYIWTFQDPLNSSFTNYEQLRANTSFGGDVHILLSGRSAGTGLARVGGLCSQYNKGVARLYTTETARFPNYNIDVALFAHELGHILGSLHTYECAWGPNNDRAIDNCGSAQIPWNNCNPAPPPSNGGTIMGQCSNYSLLNGFGPEPANRISQYINSSSCVKEEAFYTSCNLDSSVIWMECGGTETTIVKGIVFGKAGQRFNSRITNISSTIGFDTLLNLPYNTELTLGSWNTSTGTALLKITDNSDNSCALDLHIFPPTDCIAQTAPDLNLIAATATPSPAQYANFSITYTLKNEGLAPSQNVQVQAPIVQGIVYQGGNTHQTSTGTYNSVADVWTIPSLAAGDSATLTLNYFNLNTNPKKLFAQVAAMSGIDPDSEPGNNNTGVPEEDDEASFLINGFPACQINAQISNITCNDKGTAADPADDIFSFFITVTGSTMGLGWRSSINGAIYNGVNGLPVFFSGFPIASGNVSLTIADVQYPVCQTTISIQAPAPCSNSTNPQPCASTSEFPWHEWIAGVKIGTFEQLSNKSNYSDYTSKKIDFTTGIAKPLTLTTAFSYFAYDEYWKVWIDLNGDGALDNATETVFQGKLDKPANGNATHAILGQITIPNGTAPGARLLRVSMKRGGFPTPCEKLPFGEVEDYTANISAGNGGGACSLSAVLWAQPCDNNGTSSTTDDTYGFSVLVSGTDTGASGWTGQANGRNISGLYGQTATFGGFPIAGGNLSVSIRDAEKTSCTTSGNVTAPQPCSSGGGNPQPCASSSDFPWHEWIANVKIGAFDYASGKSSYSDFSSISIGVKRNTSLPIALTAGYSWQTYNAYWKIWVDFNQDGAFDDATETAFQGMKTAPPIGTTSSILNGLMSIPATAKLGNTKVRVSMKRGSYPTPCEVLDFGEVEEYTLSLVEALKAGDKLVQREKAHIEDAENNILIYPNPTSDRLKMEWLGGPAQVHLSNATGVVLRSEKAENALEMDLSGVSEGLYFVTIKVDGKRAVVRKVVVLR